MASMTSLTIAVAQFAATIDPDRNRESCVELVNEVQGRPQMQADHPALVVLPEYAMYYDGARERPQDNYSEPLDGPFVAALATAAREAGCHVMAGMTETSDEARPYNTVVHLASDGSLAGLYRKVHLYNAFGTRESDIVRPGPITAYVARINGFTIGVQTCYDLRFPEITRTLADAGADVVVCPAAWAVGPLKEFHWESLIVARAIENTVYVAAAGQTGPVCTGESMIVDPMGVKVAAAGEAAMAVATATIRADRIAQVRAKNPSLANRRFTVVALGY
jgi:predicted amidohydrolase